MPSNTISVTDLVANKALAAFVNNNSFIATANRGYAADFQNSDYRIGDNLRIRKQNHFTVVNGPVAIPEAVQEETVNLTIDKWYVVPMQFNLKELSLSVDPNLERYTERYIEPAMQELVRKIELDVAEQVLQTNFALGAANTPINTFAAVDVVGAYMEELAMPMHSDPTYMALTPRDSSALKSSLQNAFNKTLNQDISFGSRLGQLSYFDMFSNSAIRRHTTGSNAGAPVVNGTLTSGATSVVLASATPSATGVFKEGDVISFTGTNSVNPIGRSDTGQLMQFRVTADANANGGGAVTVNFEPAMISDPGNPRRNVTAPITDGVSVTLFGVTAPGTPVTYNVNAAYCKRGLDLVIPPMEPLMVKESYVKTDKESNISIRVSQAGDVINGQNALRMECLVGSMFHPQYAVRVAS